MRAKRIDANQNEIVKAFRSLGCSVFVTSALGHGFPDIAVGLRGRNYFFEIKDGKKCASSQKLTEDEVKFMQNWKGHYEIIRCVDDVIKTVNNMA